jgi:hypothetical protein
LPIDQARLRPHLRERAQLLKQQARVFEGEYRRAAEAGVDTSSPAAKVPPGSDPERMRGLPVVAPGVAGAQPGSNPVRALLRAEARRERRR